MLVKQNKYERTINKITIKPCESLILFNVLCQPIWEYKHTFIY